MHIVIKKYIKALMALSYVDVEQVHNTFNELRESSDFPGELIGIYSYFYNNYISENGRYSINLWHSKDLLDINISRTNNAIEGWHNVFKNMFGTSRYCFELLVQKLKDEE